MMTPNCSADIRDAGCRRSRFPFKLKKFQWLGGYHSSLIFCQQEEYKPLTCTTKNQISQADVNYSNIIPEAKGLKHTGKFRRLVIYMYSRTGYQSGAWEQHVPVASLVPSLNMCAVMR